MHLRRHGILERTIMATPIPASSILDALPSEVSRGLFAHGRSVSLDAEQTLFLAGDKGDGCYRVEEGLLKASVGAPNGSERILGILGPGSVVGGLAMIHGAPRLQIVFCKPSGFRRNWEIQPGNLPRRDEDVGAASARYQRCACSLELPLGERACSPCASELGRSVRQRCGERAHSHQAEG